MARPKKPDTDADGSVHVVGLRIVRFPGPAGPGDVFPELVAEPEREL